MKKIIFLLSISFILIISSCQNGIFKKKPGKGTWRFSTLEICNLQDIIQTPDNLFCCTGYTTYDGAIIYANDDQCQLVWKKEYSEFADAIGIAYTSDNHLVATAMENDGAQDIGPAVLLKLDMKGNEKWRKSFMYGARTKIYDVIETSDGGYMMCGCCAKVNDYGWVYYYALVIKTDKDGNEVFHKFLGKPNAEVGDEYVFYDMEKINDKYVCVGNFLSYDDADAEQAPHGYGYIVEIDENGGVVFEETRKYLGSFSNCVTTPKNEVAITCENGDFRVIKLNSNFEEIWIGQTAKSGKYNSRLVGDRADIIATSDNGFFATDGNRMYKKYDENGNIVAGGKEGGCFTPTNDGYYMLANRLIFIKMDINGDYKYKND